ncbi:MAG: hypothetical protein US69_C0023G0002 [candidate division TM6 bacterium GW2011_GWF2_38_10]|nr:MAG: hypothetical protein US69_C0023G0002 [candidate division TM6 bacterium GW2011_GWF2_38_10]
MKIYRYVILFLVARMFGFCGAMNTDIARSMVMSFTINETKEIPADVVSFVSMHLLFSGIYSSRGGLCEDDSLKMVQHIAALIIDDALAYELLQLLSGYMIHNCAGDFERHCRIIDRFFNEIPRLSDCLDRELLLKGFWGDRFMQCAPHVKIVISMLAEHRDMRVVLMRQGSGKELTNTCIRRLMIGFSIIIAHNARFSLGSFGSENKAELLEVLCETLGMSIDTIFEFLLLPSWQLEDAVFADDLAALDFLCKKCQYILHDTTRWGVSVLALAALAGSVKVFEFLYNHNGYCDDYVLVNAIRGGQLQIITQCFVNEATIDPYFFYESVRYHRGVIMGWLLEKAYGVEHGVGIAALYRNIPYCAWCMGKGLSVNALACGDTPLHYAVEQKDLYMMRLLLFFGADCSAYSARGITPLHSAVAHGSKEAVSLLLAAGAAIDIKSASCGATPLHCATIHADSSMVWFLLSQGACVNAQSDQGMTPLHDCVVLRWLQSNDEKNDDCVMLCRDVHLPMGMWVYKLIPFISNDLKKFDYLLLMRVLLLGGANPNIVDAHHKTALHYAVQGDLYNEAYLLLLFGASLDIADNDGHLPQHMVQSSEMAELLCLFDSGGTIV